MPALLPRDTCYEDGFGDVRCYRSAWSDWVRWLVLGLIVLLFFGLFIVCSCITSRRRRRAGLRPYRGTGWAAGAPNNAPNTYAHYQNQPPPPQYTPQPQPQHYGEHADYYGQEQGIHLQQPGQTYQRTGGPPDDVYAPPSGPPPGKGGHDGIIR